MFCGVSIEAKAVDFSVAVELLIETRKTQVVTRTC